MSQPLPPPPPQNQCRVCGIPIAPQYYYCYEHHLKFLAVQQRSITFTFTEEDRQLWRKVQHHRLTRW